MKLSEIITESLKDWRALGIDIRVSSYLLKHYNFSHNAQASRVSKPKASEIEFGHIYAGTDEYGSVLIFKKPYEGVYVDGNSSYIKISIVNDKPISKVSNSLADAFKGVKGPFTKIDANGWGEFRNTVGSLDQDQVDDKLNVDPLKGGTDKIYQYMNKTFMPSIKNQIDDMIDEIYMLMRKLPDNNSDSSPRKYALQMASSLEKISNEGFNRKSMEQFLKSVGTLSTGFGSVPRNNEELKKQLREPNARAKWAKVIVDAAKSLHSSVTNMAKNQ